MPRFQRPYVWKEEEREQHGFVSLKIPTAGRSSSSSHRPAEVQARPRAGAAGEGTFIGRPHGRIRGCRLSKTCTKRGPGLLRSPAVFAQLQPWKAANSSGLSAYTSAAFSWVTMSGSR